MALDLGTAEYDALASLRDAALAVLAACASGEGISGAQAHLSGVYDRYRTTYGPVNRAERKDNVEVSVSPPLRAEDAGVLGPSWAEALAVLRDAAIEGDHEAEAEARQVAELLLAELSVRQSWSEDRAASVCVAAEVLTTWKLPKLGGFRTDPDWPLVAALEVVDRETETYDRAPIFTERVIGGSELEREVLRLLRILDGDCDCWVRAADLKDEE